MAENAKSSTSPTPGNLVCEFHKKKKSERASHKSTLAASAILIESLEIERGYALCCRAKSEEAADYYRDLDNFELFDMQKSSEIIKANIKALVGQDTELGKAIAAASKSLNDLKKKLQESNDAACQMHNCLQSLLGFKEEKTSEKHKLSEKVACVTELAKKLSKHGQEAAAAMVKVAGIHTFSNLETLQPFGDELVKAITSLKSGNDSLIAAAKKDEEKSQADLTLVVQNLNAEEFKSFGTAGVINGYNRTLGFICEGECQPITCVEEICKEIGKCESEAGEAPHGQFATGDKD
ncbi:MAG: hypothetical protein GDA68_02850 [Nitrospira sp. CR2.1]|nr:hypothetical protein [Nitrospira sp. CR2.1]